MATSKLLYIFWKIIGLCPFQWSQNGIIKFSYFGAFYSMLITILYIIAFVNCCTSHVAISEFHETIITAIADYAATASEFFMIVITWLYFGFRQRRLQKLQKSFAKIVQSNEFHGVSGNKNKIVKRIKLVVAIVNCVWIILFVDASLRVKYTPVIDGIIWKLFNLGRITYPNFVIMFIGTMNLIHDQFRLLNDEVREFSRRASTKITIRETKQPNNRLDESGDEIQREFHPLAAYGRLHSELVDLTKSMVDFCSLPLYLIVITHSLQLGDLIYQISFSINDPEMWELHEHPSLRAVCFWTIIHSGGLIAEVAVSESIVHQANKMGCILHRILDSNSSPIVLETVQIMSLRLLQRPLEITLFGLLPMKFCLIGQIVAFLTTYITIMMQLDGRKNE